MPRTKAPKTTSAVLNVESAQRERVSMQRIKQWKCYAQKWKRKMRHARRKLWHVRGGERTMSNEKTKEVRARAQKISHHATTEFENIILHTYILCEERKDTRIYTHSHIVCSRQQTERHLSSSIYDQLFIRQMNEICLSSTTKCHGVCARKQWVRYKWNIKRGRCVA